LDVSTPSVRDVRPRLKGTFKTFRGRQRACENAVAVAGARNFRVIGYTHKIGDSDADQDADAEQTQTHVDAGVYRTRS
jgi:hypothetical protein